MAKLGLRTRLNEVRHTWRNAEAVYRGTQPGAVLYQAELQRLLDVDQDWLAATAAEYRACPAAWRRLTALRSSSRATDGIAKSMDIAEGWVAWAVVKRYRPRCIVELGTQLGISARLWKEALKTYVPEHTLILCDIEDRRRFIGDTEATFVLGDANQTLPAIFEQQQVGLLFNDAHPYELIRWSTLEGLRRRVPVLAYHDVSLHSPRATYNPRGQELAPEQRTLEPEVLGTYGAWERHVMGEVLDARLLHEDYAETADLRVQVFDSTFGLGVAVRRDVTPPQA